MTKVLFAILTCNRFHYMKNCVDSIFEFVDLYKSEVMILDNCTVDPDIDEYYEFLGDKVSVKRFKDRVPNELYRAMNYAIKYCIKKKIPYINFIQDDYQYLYHMPNMVQDIVSLMDDNKDIGQAQTNMVWKRKSVGKYSTRRVGKTNYAVLGDKNLCDSGFTRVRLYKKVGMYPSGVISYDQDSRKTMGFGKNRYKKHVNGEIWFGSRCRRLGVKRAISLRPNMTMMYDCAYVRKWDRFGRYFPPPNKYYIKPLEADEIKNISRKNKKKSFSFIEEATQADGWKPTTFGKHNKEGIITPIEH